MSDQKEYIVTLKSKDDLDGFYKDIETPGGNLHIPDRSVECCKKRPISRNTHYMLTDEEADMVRGDPRVLGVERVPKDIGLFPIRYFEQFETTWNKSNSNISSHKNWGLLRCFEGEQRPGWGSNGTTSQSGTVRVNPEGRNVDVVIVDGFFDPTHPEFAVNADGTGGSRVIQYNWFQHDNGQASSNYVYTPYVDLSDSERTDDNNHGAHVAGTVAGNTQGWARSANVYNINPYSTDVNQVSTSILIDFIRDFHDSKPINPVTGRRNPTICNHSWGFGSALAINQISSVTFRGTTTSGPFTEQQIRNFGIFTRTINGTIFAIRPARVLSLDVDMEDASLDGIIMVGSAGNDSTKIDVLGGQDFNNFFVWDGFVVPYHRGSSPAAANRCICVGAINDLTDDSKAQFSNTGPRVDLFAPGVSIMSSLNSTNSFGGTTDPRNSSFFIGKISGTSMASPQVCGILTCLLETYPNLTQDQAIEYIKFYSKSSQIPDSGGDVTDYTSLQGADNRYLAYFEERVSQGIPTPKNNVFVRPQTGQIYPRTRIRR